MKNKIRNKYIAKILTIIAVALGGTILIYNIFAEDYYIKRCEEQIMLYYDEILDMKLSDLSVLENEKLGSMANNGYEISIVGNGRMVFSSLNTNVKKNILRKNQQETYEKYSENPNVEKIDGQLLVHGKKKEKGREYLIYINLQVETLKNSIAVFSDFLFIEMGIVLIIGLFLAIQIGNNISKPIVKLSEITNKMRTNQYDGDEIEQRNDEIGELANNIKEMHDEIAGHVNELSNYNYLLEQKNKDLVEFDKNRKEFINKATHELKTPLAIISSQMEMVNLEYPEVISEYYNSMSEEIAKMSKLIKDMLNSSFYEIEKSENEMEVSSLSQLIKSMHPKYKIWMESKKINCSINIQDDIKINMDSEQIEQAINNYIINAYEHTPKNGKVIISLYKVDNNARITVFNEGENIDEGKLNDIWNSYNKGKQKTNANVGLGLYIVKNVVNKHNGLCGVENKQNGVEFFMEFELA